MIVRKYRIVLLNPFLWIAIFVLQVTGCSHGENPSTTANKLTYICLETHKIVVLPKTETPAVNPETGRRTLVAARYCQKCRKWYPVPQSAGIGGQPAKSVCPVDGLPLVVEQDSD